MFDFEEVKWSKPRTNNVKPSPRYGQSQVEIYGDLGPVVQS